MCAHDAYDRWLSLHRIVNISVRTKRKMRLQKLGREGILMKRHPLVVIISVMVMLFALMLPGIAIADEIHSYTENDSPVIEPYLIEDDGKVLWYDLGTSVSSISSGNTSSRATVVDPIYCRTTARAERVAGRKYIVSFHIYMQCSNTHIALKGASGHYGIEDVTGGGAVSERFDESTTGPSYAINLDWREDREWTGGHRLYVAMGYRPYTVSGLEGTFVSAEFNLETLP